MKMIKALIKPWNLAAILFFIGVFGCASTIATYDHYAYVQTTDLKVEALSLMDKAIDSVSKYLPAIEVVEMKLNKAYEYEKGRPKNEISANMWALLKNPEKHLLGGVLKRWQNEKQLSTGFIENEKKMISDAFDIISGLESKKINPSDAQSQFQKIMSK